MSICKKIDLVVKRGFFQTETPGKRQRYFCKDCKRRFIGNDGFYRIRNSSHKINLYLDLFFKGVSTRKIQEYLQSFYPAVLIILIIWSVIWKGIALWKCGRQNQLTWFVVILIFNTVGILPIVYLLFFQKSKKTVKVKKR